jgi:hypothetical protein
LEEHVVLDINRNACTSKNPRAHHVFDPHGVRADVVLLLHAVNARYHVAWVLESAGVSVDIEVQRRPWVLFL